MDLRTNSNFCFIHY